MNETSLTLRELLTLLLTLPDEQLDNRASLYKRTYSVDGETRKLCPENTVITEIVRIARPGNEPSKAVLLISDYIN